MKVRELRIGNLVKCTLDAASEINETCHIEDRPSLINNEHFEILKVDVSGDLEILIGIEPIEVELKEIDPIPLTEEWLIKFGFKNWGDKYTWSTKARGGVIVHKRKRGWVVRKNMPIIEYVHQLQNIYFALTGKELKTNEG